MSDQQRFEGRLAEEYDLITLAYPDFAGFQSTMVRHLTRELPGGAEILEIGTGNGFTTDILLAARPDWHIITLDNDSEMVAQATTRLSGAVQAGRLEIVAADARSFLEKTGEGAYHAIASAFTLHNMRHGYRAEVEGLIFRALRPGGLFANADKYGPDDDNERFDALRFQVERFFEAFVPLGKIELLRDWVVHNIADQSPEYAMQQGQTVRGLEDAGFVDVIVSHRSRMQAVLTARKPI